ncbi:MAG: response regulator transcription factor [Dolichospermum sp. DET73]|nr:response regulator transcription factor [Dolichospermum sp. DET73]
MSQNLSEDLKLKVLVVDDHETILAGTVEVIKKQYPNAEIITAQTAQDVLNLINNFQPNLLVLDLAIPEYPGVNPVIETGLQILRTVMQKDYYPELHIVVLTSHRKSLVQVRDEIEKYEKGGFTVADKTSLADFLKKVDWALQGISHTKDVGISKLELKPEWFQVLQLAFIEDLKDTEIAKRQYISLRSIKNYWNKIRDVLGVYPEDDKDIKIQTYKKAKEEGFIE